MGEGGRGHEVRARRAACPTTSARPRPAPAPHITATRNPPPLHPPIPCSEHRISVKHRVTEGSNSVAFVIYPAILESFARNASYPYPAPILTYQVVAPYNFLRKPASDFGWDWGPAYAPSGVYGSVDLVAYTAGVLTGASAHQAHAPDGSWVALTFDAYVEAAAAGETGVVSVDGPWSASVDATLATAGLNVVPVTVNVTAPFDLWWPVGYGAQPLYDFTVTYTPTAGAGAGAPDAHPPPPVAESAKEAMRAAGVKSFQKKGGAAAAAAVTPAFAPSSVKRRIGLRTIELVRDALTNAEGEAFYFSVNGVPIFAKGSNMIPLHIFASKTTPADLREMVQASVDANMNMLRVWGGGLYPVSRGGGGKGRAGRSCPCPPPTRLGTRHTPLSTHTPTTPTPPRQPQTTPDGRLLRRLRRGGHAGVAGGHVCVRHVPPGPRLPRGGKRTGTGGGGQEGGAGRASPRAAHRPRRNDPRPRTKLC